LPAQTAKTPGDGSGTLSYTLASDSFDIESVYAVIDATTATGPVTAELTVRDQSGVVIARKKQAPTIPAGQAGSATWALRLDDEGAASAYTTVEDEGVALPPETILNFVGAGVSAADDPANARTTVTIAGGGGGGIQFDTYPQAGGWLYVETTDATGSPHGYDVEMRAAGDVGILPQGSIVAEALHGNITIEADDGFVKIQADTTDVILFAQRFLNLEGDTSVAINSPGSVGVVSPLIDVGSGAIVYDASGAESVVITAGSITLQASTRLFLPASIDVSALPTSNPGPGLMWNNAGTVKVGT
jgi:hypothetical protein